MRKTLFGGQIFSMGSNFTNKKTFILKFFFRKSNSFFTIFSSIKIVNSVKFKPKKHENDWKNAKKKTAKKRENFNLIVNFMKLTTRKMKSNINIIIR